MKLIHFIMFSAILGLANSVLSLGLPLCIILAPIAIKCGMEIVRFVFIGAISISIVAQALRAGVLVQGKEPSDDKERADNSGT